MAAPLEWILIDSRHRNLSTVPQYSPRAHRNALRAGPNAIGMAHGPIGMPRGPIGMPRAPVRIPRGPIGMPRAPVRMLRGNIRMRRNPCDPTTPSCPLAPCVRPTRSPPCPPPLVQLRTAYPQIRQCVHTAKNCTRNAVIRSMSRPAKEGILKLSKICNFRHNSRMHKFKVWSDMTFDMAWLRSDYCVAQAEDYERLQLSFGMTSQSGRPVHILTISCIYQVIL